MLGRFKVGFSVIEEGKTTIYSQEDAWVFFITRLMQLCLEYDALLLLDICRWIQHYSEIFVQNIKTLMQLDIFRNVVFIGWIGLVEIRKPVPTWKSFHNYRSKIP
jgi:hypothetical protein